MSIASYIFKNNEIDKFKYEEETIVTNDILDNLGVKEIKVLPNFKEISVSFLELSDSNEVLAKNIVDFIFIHLFKDGYYNYNSQNEVAGFFPSLDSTTDTDGKRMLFAKMNCSMSINAIVQIRVVNKDGIEIKQNPFEKIIVDAMIHFDKCKCQWYKRLSRKLNIADKIERYENLYEFLLKDLINGMCICNKKATAAQKWITKFIAEKQKSGLLTDIRLNNPTNKPNSNDEEDDLTYIRNCFAHSPDDFSQSCRVDNSIMCKLLSTVLLAIADKK